MTRNLTVSIPENFKGAFQQPLDIIVAPDGTYAYVSSTSHISVLDLSNNTVSGTISLPLGSRPSSIAFSLDGTIAYVADAAFSAVYVIETNSQMLVKTITNVQGMFNNPSYLTVTENNLYVANEGDHTISIISTYNHTLVDRITQSERNAEGANFILKHSELNEGDPSAQPETIDMDPLTSLPLEKRAFARPSNRRRIQIEG